MKALRKLLVHNVGMKLLALAIAFLLWSAYTSEPRVEIGLDVPVEFVQVADSVEIGPEAPTQVHVRLRGRSVVLRRLVPADIAVRVNLAGMGAGEMVYQPTVEQLELPMGVELVSISPRELRIPLMPRKP